jgi:hypothetical protein
MKDHSQFFIYLILVCVFTASIRHIYEAFKKRDAEAMGEGVGTMLFSGLGILLKAMQLFP